MKNKKEKVKKRDSSSSSSTSSSSTSSSSSKGRSKSPVKKETSNVEQHTKGKTSSKRPRTPEKDLKSKWDSPDERVEKRRQPERSERKHASRDRSSDSRNRRTDNRSEKHGDGSRSSHQPYKNQHRDASKEHDRNELGENSRDRSRDARHRRDSDKINPRERENRHQRNRSRSPRRRNEGRRRRSRSKSFDHSKAVWGKGEQSDKKPPEAPKEKEKPNFALSGKLTEETNTYKGVVIKYSEPPEARKPKRRWRLYPFKGEKAMQTLYIHRESAYLIGRDRKLVDLPVDHPSCSKQHAALQYRLVPFTRDNGSSGKRVRPYLIDLDSANGTYINNKKIEGRKYVELLERDVIKFGFSSREYVVLHENSKDEAQDDDVSEEAAAAVVAPAPPADGKTEA